jgi:hypothetical protein
VAERLPPFHHLPAKGQVEFFAIEARVRRPGCGCWVLRGGNAGDGGERCGRFALLELADGLLSEAGPRSLTGSGGVVDAAQLCGFVAGMAVGDNMRGHASEVAAPGGSAVLVGDDAKFLAFAGVFQNGAEEVLARRSINPACAEEECVRPTDEEGLFPCELACAVDAERASRVGLDVGGCALAVEDVVGGVVENRRPECLRFLADNAD